MDLIKKHSYVSGDDDIGKIDFSSSNENQVKQVKDIKHLQDIDNIFKQLPKQI